MAPDGWHKFYVPEIHDVYPGMVPGVGALREMFPVRARDDIAWSIVPNWQGAEPFDADPGLSEDLRGLPGLPVLHGWTHSLGPEFNWLLYGHDNRSEFRGLSRADAADRLDRGSAVFQAALGRAPAWFCAPRWQLSRGAEAELRARGFRGHLGRAAIEVYGAGSVPMPALNFDEGERAWRTALALRARRGTIRRLLAAERPFRLVIHPNDALHGPTRTQIAELTEALEAAGWRALGVEAAVALWQGRA